MKKLKLIAALLITSIAFNACDEPVKFSEPQPAGKSDLNRFPNRLKGVFKSVNDDFVIEISNRLIVMKSSNEVIIPKAEVDTSNELVLKGDMLIDSGNSISFKVNISNDTLRGIVNQNDTIFKLDNDNVLRKYRGHYFANTKNDDDSYGVMMITYEMGGHLTFSYIQKDEIENLKTVTETEEPSDTSCTTDYRFNPTKKEFRKFVNDMNGFRNETEFIRVK